MNFRFAAKRFGATVLALAPMLSFADTTIDTTAVTAAITAAAAAVGLIGAAVVAGPVIVKATYRWVRGAI